jgi:hypothetical protein
VSSSKKSGRRFTQAEINKACQRAFERGVAEGRRLEKIGKPMRLNPEAAFERAWKKHGAMFRFMFEFLVNDTKRGARSRALDAAEERFKKDRSAIEKAWSKWETAPIHGPATLDDPAWDLIEKHCTREELQRYHEERENDWSNVPLRKLLRLAKQRASRTTAS